ncbi:uncharacterized protein LOC143025373 [Oratosquilla oratoria]|uniref:uncharacterized protein LOC143025373 n=1 Tax=Oratosquilla oratoria TaxID=337810 RepID=UPI003F76D745
MVCLALPVPINKEPRKFVYQDSSRSVKRYHVYPDRIPDMQIFDISKSSSFNNLMEDNLNLGEDPTKKKEQSMKEVLEVEEALKEMGRPEETTELFPEMDIDLEISSDKRDDLPLSADADKMNEKEITEKEMMDKEMMEKEMMEKEKMEKEIMGEEMKEKEMIEKEMMEKEMMEKEMMEKEMMEKEMREKEMMEKEMTEEEDVMTTTLMPGEEEMTMTEKEMTTPEKVTFSVESRVTPGAHPIVTSDGGMRVMTVGRTEITVTEGEGERNHLKKAQEEEEQPTTEVATDVPLEDEMMVEEEGDLTSTTTHEEVPVTEPIWDFETSTQEVPGREIAPENTEREPEVEATTFSFLDLFP